MDLGSTLVGLIIIALCVIPFILLSRGSKRKNKQMLLELESIAKEQSCIINKHEFCGDFVIAIDEAKKHLFFYKENNQHQSKLFVDLAHIKSCRINKVDKRIQNMDGAYTIIDKLSLCFKPRANNQKEIQLELYNSDVNLQLSGELQLIEAWQQLINSRL